MHNKLRTIKLTATKNLAMTISFAISVAGCASPRYMSVKNEQLGVIQCFKEDTSVKPTSTCELSAAARVNDTLVFANDKPIPMEGMSPVFSVSLKPENNTFALGDNRTYFTKNPAFRAAMKYESMTVTPDDKWVIAATAFDRYNSNKPEQVNYNTVLAWKPSTTDNQPDNVETISSKGEDKLFLRNKLLASLREKDPSIGYFKVEGLTAIPDGNNHGKLLFGIREIGVNYDNPKYSVKIIQALYDADIGVDIHSNDFKAFDIGLNNNSGHQLGLSSIEFDSANQRLYFLTSYEGKSETPDSIGGYLWVLPLNELDKKNAKLQPIMSTKTQQQHEFKQHKPEGLAVLDKDHILVVFDDDRISTPKSDKCEQESDCNRKINESVYTILELE